MPEAEREERGEVPDWAHDILRHGERLMHERIWSQTAREYHTKGSSAPWQAKEHVTERTVWRVCRDLWGEVPRPISREVLWSGHEEWNESAPEESQRLMCRLIRTLGECFQAAADGFIFEYERQMESAHERGDLEVLVHVTRDSIEVRSVLPKSAFPL
jgi:hypothetical protein